MSDGPRANIRTPWAAPDEAPPFPFGSALWVVSEIRRALGDNGKTNLDDLPGLVAALKAENEALRERDNFRGLRRGLAALKAENATLRNDLVRSSSDMGRICAENEALRDGMLAQRKLTGKGFCAIADEIGEIPRRSPRRKKAAP